MADRFWVGGTGNWTGTAHWSAISGGAAGASEPTSADNVFFDENSFTEAGQTVTIFSQVQCLNMDWTGAPYNPTIVYLGGSFNIYGSLTYIQQMDFTGALLHNFYGNTPATITTAGKILPGSIRFQGQGAVFVLQDDLTILGSIELWATTLNTNGKNVSCANFSFPYAVARNLILGSTVLTLSGTFSVNPTELTIDAGTSTIILTGNSKTFAGGGFVYNNVEFLGTPITVTGSNTFNDLKLIAGSTVNFTAGTTQTVTNLSGDGAAGNLITIQSTAAGSPFTLTKAGGGVISRDYMSVKDVTGSPDDTWYMGTHSTNVSGNTNIYFTGPPMTSITITNTETEIRSPLQITMNILPIDHIGTVLYSSSNTNIATISSSGLVTAKSVGSVTITAYSSLNTAVNDTLILDVIPVGTGIRITPPGAAAVYISAYEKCTTNLSSADRAGSFSLELKEFDSNLIDTFVFGSDVLISQDGHLFRGWVIEPSKALNGKARTISLSGADYTAKTQKIIVTESYVNQTISFIVNDLFASYATWATRSNIETCSEVITIKFADKYLWDVMEQICKISGYEWYIDENLDVHFFQPESRINANTITVNTFKKGSAKLKPDYSKIVNKLWVKGGKALSEDFTQAITVGTIPIPLLYTPRATADGVVVTIDGLEKTLGIQNIDAAGTKDFLLNFSEKLLVPDQCTTGTGTIVYKYEYPIKILLEDPISQAQYGVFEDIFVADTNDRTIARDMGLRHLYRYSQPVYTGSIAPFEGIYHPGEQVLVTIPNLNIDGYLQIKAVSYDSTPAIAKVDRVLQIESPERDLSSIMKALNNRITKLEDEVYQSEAAELSVERYIPETETTTWGEQVTEFVTILNSCSDTLFWIEDTLLQGG